MIGRNVDLDLLFLFPQMDSRIIGGVEGCGKLARSAMVESKRRKKKWGERGGRRP